MIIGMFTDTYQPQINGVVTSIDTFAKELRNRGHEVHIFAPKDGENKNKFVHSFGSFKFPKYPEYRIGAPFKLIMNYIMKKDLADKKFDIIHVHSPAPLGMAGAQIAKKLKIPLVGTYHTSYHDYVHYFTKNEKFQKIYRKMVWKYCRYFFKKCDIVIVPSKDTAKLLDENGIDNEKAVIPTGIETSLFKGDKKKLRKKYGFGNEKLILHVGRVTKEKNIETIINASMNIDDCRLIITSDGPERKKLEEFVKENGFMDRVVFTGFLSAHELQDYYKLSDVFVMASKTETQGIVLLEALRGGLAIVVLEAPVIADFTRDNKIGFVAKDQSDLTVKIKKALTKNKYENYRDKTLNKFSIEKTTDDLLDVYRKASGLNL